MDERQADAPTDTPFDGAGSSQMRGTTPASPTCTGDPAARRSELASPVHDNATTGAHGKPRRRSVDDGLAAELPTKLRKKTSNADEPNVAAEMHDSEFNAVGQQAWDYAYNGQSAQLETLMRQQSGMRPETWLHPEFRSSPLHAACYSRNGTAGCVRVLAQADGRRDKTMRNAEHHQKNVLDLAWPPSSIQVKLLNLGDAEPAPATAIHVSADGATPLFIACCRGKADALEILLQSGADPTIPIAQGTTPHEICQMRKDTACLGLLQKAGRFRPLSPSFKHSFSTASSPEARSNSPMQAIRPSPIAAKSISSDLEPSSISAGASSTASGPGIIMRPPAPPSWERVSSSIKWLRPLGAGSFGKAYEVECGGMTMSAKKIEFLVAAEREQAVALLRREFRALNSLNHPSILQPLGVIIDDPHSVSLLTELMPLGSLRMMLDNTPELVTSDPATQLRLATNIVSAMECLHNRGMQHHDLKSDNLLLKYTQEPGQGQVLVLKIADFGMATGTGSSTLRTTKPTGAGTPAYKAPELFEEDNPPFTNACDVYAFAVCVWEIITGDVPWAAKTELTVMRALDKGERPPLTASQQGTYLGDMITRCWVADAERRPSFVQLHREINSQPRPGLSQRQLLVFACSPHVSPLRQAGSEAVSVLLATSWGESCSIHWGGTAAQLQDALTFRKTRRLLFSGHADAVARPRALTKSVGPAIKSLGFTKPGGDLEVADPAMLAETLGRFKLTLELVFLNGCDSLGFGRLLFEKGIRTVVCWSTKVEDAAASLFATEFFALIARGSKSAREAFDGAREKLAKHTRAVSDTIGNVHDVPMYELRTPFTPPTPGYNPLWEPRATGLPVLISDENGIKEYHGAPQVGSLS